MKLSLSGRLWEMPGGYRIGLSEHITIAKKLGYDGIEIRYPMLPANGGIEKVRAQLQSTGIEAVFCFCADLPHDAGAWNDVMRVVRTVHELGGTWVRVAIKHEAHLAAVAELAGRAEELDIRVLLHLHANTLCDTPSRAISCLERIDHPKVALLLDPLHLALGGEMDMLAAVARLFPWIGLFNIQNFRRTTPEEPPGELAGSDGFWTHIPPGQPGGLNFEALSDIFKRCGYEGWLNVACPTSENEDVIAIAKNYFDVLAPWRRNQPCIAA